MKALFKIDGGKISATRSFIVECGCAGAVAAVNTALKQARIPNNYFSRVKLSGNKLAKQYLQENGYYDKVMATKKSSYASLIDIDTSRVIDFLSKDKEKLRRDITDVFQRK